MPFVWQPKIRNVLTKINTNPRDTTAITNPFLHPTVTFLITRQKLSKLQQKKKITSYSERSCKTRRRRGGVDGPGEEGVVTAGCDCDCSRQWRNWVSGADGGAWAEGCTHTFSTSPHKTPLQHQTSHSGRWLGVRGQWLRPLLSRPGCVAAPGRIRRTRMRPPFPSRPIVSWSRRSRGLNSIREIDSEDDCFVRSRMRDRSMIGDDTIVRGCIFFFF